MPPSVRGTHHSVGAEVDDWADPEVDVDLILVEVLVQVAEGTGAGPGIFREVEVRHVLPWAEPIGGHRCDLMGGATVR